MAEELKACPFCGGDAENNTHSDSCYFTVNEAFQERASSNADLSLAPAVLRAWNKRAQLPSQGGEAVAIVCGSQVQWLPGAGRVPDRSKLYTHPGDQVAEGVQHARDSEELRSLCAARDQYRDLSIKYGDKLSEALQLLTRCQENLHPHRDAALWSDVCAALGPKP